MAKDGQKSRNTSVLRRVRRQRDRKLESLAERPLFQFVAFGLFVVAMVLVMTAGTDESTTSYGDYTVGQVAPHDVKATRDFSFTEKNIDASRDARAEAAREVPSVYDWQEGRGEELRDRIARAFGGMRDAMASTIQNTLATAETERLEALQESTPPARMSEALIDVIGPRQRVRMARELRDEVFDAELAIELPDDEFETFARAGFPAEAENALASIVGSQMSNIIVSSERVLEEEGERGVYLRRLRDDKLLIEYHVANIGDRFVTPDEIPARVEKSAVRTAGTLGDEKLRNAVVSTAVLLISPNTTFNEARSVEKREAARQSVEDTLVSEDFQKGQVIVDKGHIITERHIRIIQKMQEEQEYLNQTQIVSGVVVFSLLFLVTLYMFGRRNIKKFHPGPKDVVFMGTAMLLMLSMTRLGTTLSNLIAQQIDGVPPEAWYFAIPVATAGMLIRLVLNSETAVVFTLLFAMLVGIVADNSLFFMSYAMIGGLVGAGTVGQVRNRMALMWSGLVVSVVNVTAILGFLLIQGELLQFETLAYAALGFAGGIASGFVVLAVLPLFESMFGYTTDIKLLELSNLNHPALRELIMRAPGSYHHSMMVGSLCESAAEAIGCNSLLVRVGAYYHDIGKAKNPQYFAENQKAGDNPHDRLKPNMSALIIKAHVKDGLEMARQHRLPKIIQDFIAQHHGTSLIAYFYHKAKELEDPDIPEVDEKDYRYPGPRPQTRETAICLLADGIEAASRAMPDPTPARLKGLVQKMINKAFTDGQLDECDLTLKDLNEIASAFTRILTGIYHHRPEYPSDKKPSSGPSTPRAREQEPNRSKQRTTGKQTSVTREEADRPRDDDAEPAARVSSLADSSSDVWEITAEKVQNIEDDLNAGRNNRSRDGDDASEDSEAEETDQKEGRESLPRLGSH